MSRYRYWYGNHTGRSYWGCTRRDSANVICPYLIAIAIISIHWIHRWRARHVTIVVWTSIIGVVVATTVVLIACTIAIT